MLGGTAPLTGHEYTNNVPADTNSFKIVPEIALSKPKVFHGVIVEYEVSAVVGHNWAFHCDRWVRNDLVGTIAQHDAGYVRRYERCAKFINVTFYIGR